jgi:hypothetical protein
MADQLRREELRIVEVGRVAFFDLNVEGRAVGGNGLDDALAEGRRSKVQRRTVKRDVVTTAKIYSAVDHILKDENGAARVNLEILQVLQVKAGELICRKWYPIDACRDDNRFL